MFRRGAPKWRLQGGAKMAFPWEGEGAKMAFSGRGAKMASSGGGPKMASSGGRQNGNPGGSSKWRLKRVTEVGKNGIPSGDIKMAPT